MRTPVCSDENQVPAYVLPVLGHSDETLTLFAEHIYGHTPSLLPDFSPRVEALESGPAPFPTSATRCQFRVSIGESSFTLLFYTPHDPAENTCTFLGLNFGGNHTIHSDPAILLPQGWMYPWENTGVVDHRATDAGRGTRERRWPVAEILRRGHSLATVHCGDLAPDLPGHPDIARFKQYFVPAADPQSEWGGIGIWAWTLSRALDVLLSHTEIDGKRVWAIGHSRLGKTALWAAAQDSRFAGAISNNSGCLGAALSRRCFGETVAHISGAFPHWFCPRLAGYAGREAEMPVDQHQLLALLAPRPLYVASASEDLWADPRGEFLAALAASPAWQSHGFAALRGMEFPPVETPRVGERMAYHLRRGPHDILRYDWDRFMDFAEL